jgi:VanZ family protein
MRLIRILLPWAFWIPFGVATYMAWTPGEHLKNSLPNDKFMHLVAFGYLTGAFAVACAPWATWARTIGIMLAYAILIEVVQAFIPTRSFSLLDMVADGMGIVLALSGLYAIRKAVGWLRQDIHTL